MNSRRRREAMVCCKANWTQTSSTSLAPKACSASASTTRRFLKEVSYTVLHTQKPLSNAASPIILRFKYLKEKKLNYFV